MVVPSITREPFFDETPSLNRCPRKVVESLIERLPLTRAKYSYLPTPENCAKTNRT